MTDKINRIKISTNEKKSISILCFWAHGVLADANKKLPFVQKMDKTEHDLSMIRVRMRAWIFFDPIQSDPCRK